MVITIFMLFFLIIIPGSFRKKGIALISDKKNIGIFLVVFSKFIYWMPILEIAYIWTGSYINYVMILIGMCFGLGIFRDRKYIFLEEELNTSKNH